MRVLVGTDGSEYSYKAAREFLRLAYGTHHYVKILYVMPMLTVGRDTNYLLAESEREGIEALSKAKLIFDQAAIPAEVELRQGTPEDAIVAIAREGEYDLIVIGYRGRGGFREYLLGSVSKQIVQNSPCSVFIGK